jgi:hypothetical protein
VLRVVYQLTTHITTKTVLQHFYSQYKFAAKKLPKLKLPSNIEKTRILIKPYTQQELSDLYDVSSRTFRRWIKLFENQLGKRLANIYMISQVELIFNKLGIPDVAITNSTIKMNERKTKTFLEIKPYSSKDLTQMYGISPYVLKVWIKPIEEELGERVGSLYNIRQVTKIFETFGVPGREIEIY